MGLVNPLCVMLSLLQAKNVAKCLKIQGASRPMPLFICKGSLNVNFVTITLLHRNKLKPMLGSTTRRLKQEKSISVIYVGKYLTMNLFYTITECFTNLPTIRNCKNRPKDKRLPNHPEGQLHPPRKLQLLFSLHLHQKNLLLHLVNNQGHPQPNQTYFL